MQKNMENTEKTWLHIGKLVCNSYINIHFKNKHIHLDYINL